MTPEKKGARPGTVSLAPPASPGDGFSSPHPRPFAAGHGDADLTRGPLPAGAGPAQSPGPGRLPGARPRPPLTAQDGGDGLSVSSCPGPRRRTASPEDRAPRALPKREPHTFPRAGRVSPWNIEGAGRAQNRTRPPRSPAPPRACSPRPRRLPAVLLSTHESTRH